MSESNRKKYGTFQSTNDAYLGQVMSGSIEEFVSKSQSIPWRGILALIGGFLIQLTLGSFYSFGNMMTYLTSYMR